MDSIALTELLKLIENHGLAFLISGLAICYVVKFQSKMMSSQDKAIRILEKIMERLERPILTQQVIVLLFTQRGRNIIQKLKYKTVDIIINNNLKNKKEYIKTEIQNLVEELDLTSIKSFRDLISMEDINEFREIILSNINDVVIYFIDEIEKLTSTDVPYSQATFIDKMKVKWNECERETAKSIELYRWRG